MELFEFRGNIPKFSFSGILWVHILCGPKYQSCQAKYCFCVSCPLFFFLSFKLQSASEYEERKLIRAAIRRLRDEEIRGEILSKGLDKYLYTSACVYIPLFSFTGALEKVQTTGQRTERRQNPQNCFDLQVSKCGVVNIRSGKSQG